MCDCEARRVQVVVVGVLSNPLMNELFLNGQTTLADVLNNVAQFAPYNPPPAITVRALDYNRKVIADLTQMFPQAGELLMKGIVPEETVQLLFVIQRDPQQPVRASRGLGAGSVRKVYPSTVLMPPPSQRPVGRNRVLPVAGALGKM